jgi:glycosyltransferase involved in cell wall biosynthesis
VKRHDLAVRAMARLQARTRLVIVGEGTQEAALRALINELGLGDRVQLAGVVGDEELLKLYAGALGVVYTPYDEDFGYVTLEAFLARKPVITARDSGGTLEFVQAGVNGWVCDPTPESVADAFAELAGKPARSAALGDAGYERARLVTWDGVVERLVGAQT